MTTTTRNRRKKSPQTRTSQLSKTLQRYYDIGLQAKEILFTDKIALRKLAEKKHISSDCLLKARRFVERLGNKNSLKLLSQKRKKQGTPLGWAQVRHLVSVKNDDRRYKLLEDAVGFSWSTTQLIDEIQRREGRTVRRAAGGRPPNEPTNVEAGLLRLQRLSEKWSALYQRPIASDPVENSSAQQRGSVPERHLKDRIKNFLHGDGRPASTSPKRLGEQIAGLVKALKLQAKEIEEVVKAAEQWRIRTRKQPRR